MTREAPDINMFMEDSVEAMCKKGQGMEAGWHIVAVCHGVSFMSRVQ